MNLEVKTESWMMNCFGLYKNPIVHYLVWIIILILLDVYQKIRFKIQILKITHMLTKNLLSYRYTLNCKFQLQNLTFIHICIYVCMYVYIYIYIYVYIVHYLVWIITIILLDVYQRIRFKIQNSNNYSHVNKKIIES